MMYSLLTSCMLILARAPFDLNPAIDTGSPYLVDIRGIVTARCLAISRIQYSRSPFPCLVPGRTALTFIPTLYVLVKVSTMINHPNRHYSYLRSTS